MKLFNTKSRSIEDFKPLQSREVKVYSCGPTVYNYAHVGNLRTFVFEDIVVRTLRFLGYKVTYLMNITDVEDKTIKASMEAGEKLEDYTKRYTDFFLEDMKKLNMLIPDKVVPITSLIAEMARMINTMLRRKNAYLGEDGSIYFNIRSFPNYGKFANLDMKNLKVGARVDIDEYDKESASDFVLWKAWKESDGDNYWDQEFDIDGKKITLRGRPGWHIECSACNLAHLGDQIDIHMGGVDLIFPHHQNEIAQTESCTKKEFSKYWLHSGHLMVDGKKMSKSLGNFYTLNDIEKKFDGKNRSVLYRSVRLSFISAKYSSELDFTFDKVESNFVVISSIDEAIKKLNDRIERSENLNMVSKQFSDDMQSFVTNYIEALEDNFNMPEALAIFHEFLKYVNIVLREDNISKLELISLMDMFKTFNQVLAIIDFSILDNDNIPLEIIEKLQERDNAKKEKDFKKADLIRDELFSQGYKVIDDKSGTRVEKNIV